MLHKTIRYLRRIETEQVAESAALWSVRAAEMSDTLADGAASEETTLGAFAWGGVWGQTLAAVFTSAEARVALQGAAERHAKRHAKRRGGRGGDEAERGVIVLGSSLGFEAYFASLVFGVPTVGVDLLPGLVNLAEQVRNGHEVRCVPGTHKPPRHG